MSHDAIKVSASLEVGSVLPTSESVPDALSNLPTSLIPFCMSKSERRQLGRDLQVRREAVQVGHADAVALMTDTLTTNIAPLFQYPPGQAHRYGRVPLAMALMHGKPVTIVIDSGATPTVMHAHFLRSLTNAFVNASS